jgi:hypothetical protein
VQEVFAVRSDLPPAAYRLHPQEVDALVVVPLDDAIALFDGHTPVVDGLQFRRDAAEAAVVAVTVDGFAAGEVGGYASRALRGLLAAVGGGSPEPFELR